MLTKANSRPLSPDEAEDLRWYFQDSLGDAGAKSPLGIQLDMLKSGVLCEGGFRRKLPRNSICKAVEEATTDVDMRDVLLSGLANERVLMAAARINRIGARLKRTGRDYNNILELHYAEVPQYDGVGLDLLAHTEHARLLHARSLEKANKKGPAHVMSVREWILWLITRAVTSEASKACLTLIHTEALAALDTAREAYAAAK